MLEKILASQAHITILRILCTNSSQDFSISELARETGLDKSAVSRAIRALEDRAAVLTRTRGRLKLCRINKQSKYYDMLETLFNNESYLVACGSHD